METKRGKCSFTGNDEGKKNQQNRNSPKGPEGNCLPSFKIGTKRQADATVGRRVQELCESRGGRPGLPS